MSVFTPVSEEEARAFLEHYSLGALESLRGIAQGVENTNYFLDTTTGEYVLTLFETLSTEVLPFYVDLMAYLAEHDIECPRPMARDDGERLSALNGKPAVIVSKLQGQPMTNPDPVHCRRAGALLARMHTVAVDFDEGLDNWRGREWRESFAAEVAPRLSAEENALIAAENRYQAAQDDSALPQGIIHGDYFHDNVLWSSDTEGGVIDFYFACDDALLFDVAIAVNDWCANADGTLDAARTRAFLQGYGHERPFEEAERALWPLMLRRASLRTWLGRLGYNHFPREAEVTIPKDHAFSRRQLQHHVAAARPMEHP